MSLDGNNTSFWTPEFSYKNSGRLTSLVIMTAMANGNYYTDNDDMEHQTPVQPFIPCNPRTRLGLELSWPQTGSLSENILNAS